MKTQKTADTPITVTTFYRFQPLAPEELPQIQEKLTQMGEAKGVRGLLLLGTEGFNSTLAAPHDAMATYKEDLRQIFQIQDIHFKDSYCEKMPFRRFKVKIREEIVTIGRPDLVPEKEVDHHIPPEEWHRLMEEEDVVVLDTRNTYEINLGKFKGAIDFGIDQFREFGSRLKEEPIPKDKKILIYCTGGIRCEKAILEMRQQGYENVFQLQGGILNYLKKYPHKNFEGECFVFDHRVAVDQELKASQKYRLCPHCGDPADCDIECRQCGRDEVICKTCSDKEEALQTCSKNCAHHYRHGHTTRRPHLDELKKRGEMA